MISQASNAAECMAYSQFLGLAHTTHVDFVVLRGAMAGVVAILKVVAGFNTESRRDLLSPCARRHVSGRARLRVMRITVGGHRVGMPASAQRW